MVYSIYKITNKVNNKCYVGYTQCTERRWKQHKRLASSSRRPLYESIRKHGIENFEFFVVYQSKDQQHTKSVMEPYFVNLFNSYNNGYNCTKGGDDNNTEDKKKRLSERMKRDNPMKKIRVNAGSFVCGVKNPHSSEQNEKISKALKGEKNPNYGKSEVADRINKFVMCPHCNVSTNLGNAKRWHFDNCKNKTQSLM